MSGQLPPQSGDYYSFGAYNPLASPPPQPPRKKGIFGRISGYWHGGCLHKTVVLAVAFCLLLCSCVGAGVIYDLTPAGQQALAQESATETASAVNDATATAYTLAHPPTPTPSGPIALGSAIIGGSLDAFSRKYGKPATIEGGQILDFNGIIGGQAVEIDIFGGFDLSDGNDGQLRITGLNLNIPNVATDWDKTEAPSIFGYFMPSDAQQIQAVGDTTVLGEETTYTYHSGSIAATFPPSVSNAGFEPATTPGTITVRCGASLDNTAQFDGVCSLGIGELDTQTPTPSDCRTPGTETTPTACASPTA